MKRYILLYVAALIAITSLIGTSCKKIIHSGAPTPNNVRMVGYNKITTFKMNVPTPAVPSKVTEEFRFYYDALNRVSRITYTGNDTFAIYKQMDFTYYGDDTVVKNTTNILTNLIVQRDTFIKNSAGLIVTAYTPGVKNTFEYFGKLMANNRRVANEYRNINMASSVFYTSVNGDLLKQNASGRLDVEFYDWTAPIDFAWAQGITSNGVVDNWETYNYTFNPYDHQPLYLIGYDANANVDSITFPGWDWVNESYHFYTEDANRTGDWMQLESFTMYGANIWNNNHMVESISSQKKNAYITYRKDSYNKITQTNVVLSDNLLNKVEYVYDIQYETY